MISVHNLTMLFDRVCVCVCTLYSFNCLSYLLPLSYKLFIFALKQAFKIIINVCFT